MQRWHDGRLSRDWDKEHEELSIPSKIRGSRCIEQVTSCNCTDKEGREYDDDQSDVRHPNPETLALFSGI